MIHPVIPEILNQKSDRYGPGRRIRKAATFASYVASHGNPALDTQKDEEEDHEEDYDQEESLQATPDQAEEESEEFDLPSRGHPRKRRRVAPAEEEERRSAILAQPGHRLGLWTDDSTVPATHVQRPPTGFGHADEHADESFLGGLHEGFQSYRYEPSSHSTQEYNSQSIASGQLQPLFFPDHSYSPQFHEPQIGQQGPLPNPSQTPSYGFITGDLLVDPFDNLYANTAGFGIPDNQPGSAIPMQDPSWTAQTPQMMFDDTSAGLSAELLEMADTIDWNAYELPDLPE